MILLTQESLPTHLPPFLPLPLASCRPALKTQAVRAKSDSEHVREFTGGAGQPIPNKPCPMTETEVDFITKMVLDEVMELLATVYDPSVAKEKMCKMIADSKDIPKEDYSQLETPRLQSLHQAAAQADALVDVYYYMQVRMGRPLFQL